MSERMQVRSSESGLVRLFAVDMDEAEARALSEALAAGESGAEARLAAMLGAERVLAEKVELFPVSNLAGLGVPGYLEQGHAIPAVELAPHRATLDGLLGWLLLVPSSAFDATEQVLSPKAPLRWIGTFAETPATAPGPALRSASAEGTLSPAGEAPPLSPRRSPFGLLLLGCVVLLALGLLLFGMGE